MNTLVAGNRRGAAGTTGTPDDVSGEALSTHSANSLIGDAATAGGLVNGINGNIVGVDWRAVLDPVLRDNGGPTPTHALVAGSPAIDAGQNAPFATDQRGVGFPRKFGAAVDIGAFEFRATAAALVARSDEPLSLFWSRAGEDEEFAGALLAAG